ncbi:MAG TPA: hypothetical protein VGK48_11870 [Terriglobia bacterium]|jgi:hypothetical protein
MRNARSPFVLLIFGLALSSVPPARAQQNKDFTGVWQAAIVTYPPWTFDLKQTGATLTGRVWQNGAALAIGKIMNGTVNGDTLTFKIVAQQAGNAITFTGKRNGDTIDFTRTPENAGAGGDGLYGGANAPSRLTAKLQPPGSVALPPPGALAATPQPITANFNLKPIYPKLEIGPGGKWQVMGVPNAPWTLEFTVDGTALHGTIRQTGPQSEPLSIAAGKADGNSISFKVLSPDGERTILFRGRLNGDEIAFTREITVLTAGTRGGNDLYGGAAPLAFTANRLSRTLSYKGMLVDITEIQSSPDRDAIIESVRRQIDIVDEAVVKPEQKAFIKSVPVSLNHLVSGTGNGIYTNAARGVQLPTEVIDKEKPVLLHELLHAYQDQKMADGFRNAEILKLYQQAHDDGKFPANASMLSGPVEYFAMIGAIYLHGSAARDSFTPDTIKDKQPDCYKWLEQEFGPR